MEDLVRESNSGKDSIKKSLRYLRHVWIEAGSNESLRSEAIETYRAHPSETGSILLSWGMAIATYPFLNDVASTIGRMLRVQPNVKLEQILRKLVETYGERETVRRSGRYALGLMTDFGFVNHGGGAGCYVLGQPVTSDSAAVSGCLIRAWFVATGSSSVIDRMVMAGAPSLGFFDASNLISGSIETNVLVAERLSFSQDVLRLNKEQG
jgi:hypothetical protein